MLEDYIRERRQQRDILLMTHIVLGYPSLEASIEVVDVMDRAGVDLIELQIPFSEPMADGPVILHANQKALAAGATVDQCLKAAGDLSARVSAPLLFMSYYNILFRRGVARFTAQMKAAGMKGAIVPDLPHEEGQDYLDAMQAEGLDPIFLYSPNTSDARMAEIAARARGLVYCIARKGVTGSKTDFDASFDDYIARARAATALPLALGFGVSDAADVDFLRGKVDIAVVGSQTIRVIDAQGIEGVAPFIAGLRGS